MTSPQSQQGRDSVASIPRRKENQQTLRMFLRQVAASICSRAPSSYVEISNRLSSLRHQPQLPLLRLAARPAPQGQVCPTSSSPTIARFPRSTAPPTTAPWVELRPEAGSACGSLVRQLRPPVSVRRAPVGRSLSARLGGAAGGGARGQGWRAGPGLAARRAQRPGRKSRRGGAPVDSS